jgi:hypothetical protein
MGKKTRQSTNAPTETMFEPPQRDIIITKVNKVPRKHKPMVGGVSRTPIVKKDKITNIQKIKVTGITRIRYENIERIMFRSEKRRT